MKPKQSPLQQAAMDNDADDKPTVTPPSYAKKMAKKLINKLVLAAAAAK
jgi:hypothetical protein